PCSARKRATSAAIWAASAFAGPLAERKREPKASLSATSAPCSATSARRSRSAIGLFLREQGQQLRYGSADCVGVRVEAVADQLADLVSEPAGGESAAFAFEVRHMPDVVGFLLTLVRDESPGPTVRGSVLAPAGRESEF